jgi:hypothetical protein
MPRSLSLKPLQLGTAVLCALFVFGSLPIGAEESCPSSAALQGAWTEQGGERQLRFEPDRVVLREKGVLRAASILRRERCKLVLRDDGVVATWTLKGNEHALHLDRGKSVIGLERLPQVPVDLDITPLPVPPLGPVPPEKVKEIATELRARDDRDQAAQRSHDPQRDAIVADNIRYLREVVSHYGWVDIPRFGKSAAAAAILIAKHAGDVRLTQVALPIAERDAKENGGGKELVSILVDEVLIATGHKQKYGTQIAEDEHGKPYIIPVENLAKVDDYRKELGILSWEDYVKKASQALYDGAPIRIPGPEE